MEERVERTAESLRYLLTYEYRHIYSGISE
jgi:hypothetical protein